MPDAGEPIPQVPSEATEQHEALLTTMIRSVTTQDRTLIDFAQQQYREFWVNHEIVVRPSAEPEVNGQPAAATR